jgi:hypothetical protein
MKKVYFMAILCAILFVHCKQDDKKPLLIGKWQGVSWKLKGKESGRDFKSVHFEFKTDDTYDLKYHFL